MVDWRAMAAALKLDEARRMDRRRHQRVRLSFLGRYMLADQQEHACQTLDISPGGVALIAPSRGAVGERVICYLDQFGRIEGQVARHIEGGFALAFNVPTGKREKLADKLTWHANRDALGVPEGRQHQRIIPVSKSSTLQLPDKRRYPIALVDVSVSGAAFHCAVNLEPGTLVTVGSRPSRVTRGIERGLAVQFLLHIPIEHFDETITL